LTDKRLVRSFIAIEIPQEIKSSISQLQAQMKLSEYNFVKWVSHESIHVTLKFLGNIISEKVVEIADAIKDASRGTSPFSIEIGGLGAFPNINKARVFWVGIGGETAKLVALQQKIDDSLITFGFPKEKRPFSPHITLARVRESASYHDQQDFGKLISRMRFDTKSKIDISKINLMKSQLFPTGAVYNCLAEIELDKN
jgi:2'-5' RNA ligase